MLLLKFIFRPVFLLQVLGNFSVATAFIGKADGAGQSTKAFTQSLMMPSRFQPDPNVLPEAGPMGTNKGALLYAGFLFLLLIVFQGFA